jgi:hypothetical protein
MPSGALWINADAHWYVRPYGGSHRIPTTPDRNPHVWFVWRLLSGVGVGVGVALQVRRQPRAGSPGRCLRVSDLPHTSTHPRALLLIRTVRQFAQRWRSDSWFTLTRKLCMYQHHGLSPTTRPPSCTSSVSLLSCRRGCLHAQQGVANADEGRQAYVQVAVHEVTKSAGGESSSRLLPGYSQDACILTNVTGLKMPLRWTSGVNGTGQRDPSPPAAVLIYRSADRPNLRCGSAMWIWSTSL